MSGIHNLVIAVVLALAIVALLLRTRCINQQTTLGIEREVDPLERK